MTANFMEIIIFFAELDCKIFHSNTVSSLCNFTMLLFPVMQEFFFQLLVSYLMSRDDIELNIASARLLLNLIPGLDSAVLSVSFVIGSIHNFVY